VRRLEAPLIHLHDVVQDVRITDGGKTTLGEQEAVFNKNDVVHNHLHLGENIPLEKIRALKQLFIDAMGPQATRELLGMTEEEQAQ
jgi:hypothetical protein